MEHWRIFPLSGMIRLWEHQGMPACAITTDLQGIRGAAALLCGIMLLAATAAKPADAAGCSFEAQGEGRVETVIDARTLRLQDGREVRLAGIEPVVTEKADRSALTALAAGREVTLRGENDTPDRYGRQPRRLRDFAAGAAVGTRRGVGLRRGDRQGLRGRPDGRRGARAPGKKRHLGERFGHKKRGKSGRYFGRDRALHSRRG
jgi:hypothetical protein